MATRNLPSGPYKWWLLSCLIQTSTGQGAGEVTSSAADDAAPSTPIFVHDYGRYRLQGCFQEPASGLPGEILGKDFILPTNASMSDQMTVSVCIDACDLAKPADGASFEFVALGDGKECYCGSTLSSSSFAAADANCSLPCAGDETASCGGTRFALVYNYMPEFARNGGDPASTNTDVEGDSNGDEADEATPFQPDTGPGPSTSGHMAAIVTGALLSAVLVASLAFLAFKLRRRRQRGDANAPQQSRDLNARRAPSSPTTTDDPRPGTSPSSRYHTSPTIPWSTLDTVLVDGKLALSPATSPVRPRRRSSDDLLPQPLASHAAGAGPSNHHHHHHHPATSEAATSSLQPIALPPPPPQQQQLRHSTSTSDLATPSTGILSVSDVSARSSAELDHHPAGLSPPTPRSAAAWTAVVPPSPPGPVAALPSSLGDRAWHRRKWSRAFPPPPPPSVPLPPTPPGREPGAGREDLLPAPLSLVKPLGPEVGGDGEEAWKGTREERGKEDGEVTPAFTIWTVAPTEEREGEGAGSAEGKDANGSRGVAVRYEDGAGKEEGGAGAGVGFAG